MFSSYLDRIFLNMNVFLTHLNIHANTTINAIDQIYSQVHPCALQHCVHLHSSRCCCNISCISFPFLLRLLRLVTCKCLLLKNFQLLCLECTIQLYVYRSTLLYNCCCYCIACTFLCIAYCSSMNASQQVECCKNAIAVNIAIFDIRLSVVSAFVVVSASICAHKCINIWKYIAYSCHYGIGGF